MQTVQRLIFQIVQALLVPFLAVALVGPGFMPFFVLDAERFTWLAGLLAFAWLFLFYVWIKYEEADGTVRFHPSRLVILTVRSEISISMKFCRKIFIFDVVVAVLYYLIYLSNKTI